MGQRARPRKAGSPSPPEPDGLARGAAIPEATAMRRADKDRPGRGVPVRTPDGRYIVVRGRLWRATDPALPETERRRLVAELGAARRAVAAARRVGDDGAEAAAHARVDAAKHGLGKRGPVWWHDGAPDLNRHMARTTPYADWFADASRALDDERSPR